VNGILTLYGWLLLARNTAIFVGLGAAIGLVVRAMIGPGRRWSPKVARMTLDRTQPMRQSLHYAKKSFAF
jgi:hypothetical protein